MKRSAIVTGGNKGIGRAIVLMLARHDLDVFIVGRDQTALKETQAHAPQHIHIIQADVATEEGRQYVLSSLPATFQLQFLIHNAATILPIKPIPQLTYDEWRQHLAINLEAPLFLTQALLEKLNNARVLHISSGAAHQALKGWLPYCTAKAALHMVYLCYKEELTNYPICFGSVRPGIVDTQMQADIRNDANPFDNREYFKKKKEEVDEFIKWLLFSVNDEEFSKAEWDIRDTWHQHHWKNK